MAISIRDIASQAGVSTSTVSKVLNGSRETIRPQTQERVRRIASEMGYHPNRLAQSIARRRTGTIGLMISGLQNPFFVSLLETAEALLLDSGNQILLDAAPSIAGSYAQHSRLNGWPVDGVLMWAFAEQSLEMYLGVQAREIPVVYLGSPRDDGSDWVAFDHYGGGRLAAEYLVRRGYRRIAYLGAFGSGSFQGPRYQAYADVCQEKDLGVETFELEDQAETCEAGLAGGLRLAALPAARRPEAVICVNDVLALGVSHGLRRAGLRVPDDVAVIGFDGIMEGQCEDIPLTTVLTSPKALCQEALGILTQRIAGHRGEAPRQITIPVEFLPGGTA
ncbi:MAG: LacI family DNA-binding transcriptional regulator [Janthinobacterium lividum]